MGTRSVSGRLSHKTRTQSIHPTHAVRNIKMNEELTSRFKARVVASGRFQVLV